jgi:hypothetical protein
LKFVADLYEQKSKTMGLKHPSKNLSSRPSIPAFKGSIFIQRVEIKGLQQKEAALEISSDSKTLSSTTPEESFRPSIVRGGDISFPQPGNSKVIEPAR